MEETSVYDTGAIVADFMSRQAFYSERNVKFEALRQVFSGAQWAVHEESAANTDNYQLVINYLRRVVLGYVASLGRSPKPRIPMIGDPVRENSANSVEKALMVLWDSLMSAWYDVELNAAKLRVGVLQALWNPDIKATEIEEGVKRYTENPFVFRSIKPDNFFPVYRTYSKPNDFLRVYRYDPGRLVDDLEQKYGKSLQPTGINAELGSDWVAVGTEPTCDLIEFWDAKRYILIARTTVNYAKRVAQRRDRVTATTKQEYMTLADTENTIGCIPFWVLQNIRVDPDLDPTKDGAMSDMEDIISLNQHLNHIVSEQATEIVTNIHRPVTYKSDDHQTDPAAITFGPGVVNPIGKDEELDTLNWAAQPPLVQQHIDFLVQAIGDLTFLGQAGMGKLTAGTSGIAARIALSPMEQILELKLPQRTATLQDVCRYVLKELERNLGDDGALQGWLLDQYKRFYAVVITKRDIDRNYFVTIDYGNLLPRDDYAFEQGEIYKFSAGAQSLATTLDHLGFDDPQQEISRIRNESRDVALNPEKAGLIKQLEQQQQMQPQAVAKPDPLMSAQPQQQPQMDQLMGMLGGGGGGGGMGGGQPGLQQGIAPTVPNSQSFPRSETEGGYGPGQLAPYLGRNQGGR